MSVNLSGYTPDKIKELRRRSGLTAQKMSQALDVAPHTYNKWESGERPTPHLVRRLERMDAALRDRDRTDWKNMVGMDRSGRALNVRVRPEGDHSVIQMGRIFDGLFVPEKEITLPTDVLAHALDGIAPRRKRDVVAER